METRKGFEFWDRFNKIQTYSFMLDNGLVRRIEMRHGAWIEKYEAGLVVSDAQDEIAILRAALERMLSAAECLDIEAGRMDGAVEQAENALQGIAP